MSKYAINASKLLSMPGHCRLRIAVVPILLSIVWDVGLQASWQVPSGGGFSPFHITIAVDILTAYRVGVQLERHSDHLIGIYRNFLPADYFA